MQVMLSHLSYIAKNKIEVLSPKNYRKATLVCQRAGKSVFPSDVFECNLQDNKH